jgi:hypothetical protein
MILISHRGNLDGPNQLLENKPSYIDLAIQSGFDVEIDIWYKDDSLWLGHDSPEYKIDFRWIRDRLSKLWIHCKNIESLIYLKESNYDINYFWHQNDDVTITSMGFFWTYPGKKLTTNSIAVLPEVSEFKDLEIAIGICSDIINKWKI